MIDPLEQLVAGNQDPLEALVSAKKKKKTVAQRIGKVLSYPFVNEPGYKGISGEDIRRELSAPKRFFFGEGPILDIGGTVPPYIQSFRQAEGLNITTGRKSTTSKPGVALKPVGVLKRALSDVAQFTLENMKALVAGNQPPIAKVAAKEAAMMGKTILPIPGQWVYKYGGPNANPFPDPTRTAKEIAKAKKNAAKLKAHINSPAGQAEIATWVKTRDQIPGVTATLKSFVTTPVQFLSYLLQHPVEAATNAPVMTLLTVIGGKQLLSRGAELYPPASIKGGLAVIPKPPVVPPRPPAAIEGGPPRHALPPPRPIPAGEPIVTPPSEAAIMQEARYHPAQPPPEPGVQPKPFEPVQNPIVRIKPTAKGNLHPNMQGEFELVGKTPKGNVKLLQTETGKTFTLPKERVVVVSPKAIPMGPTPEPSPTLRNAAPLPAPMPDPLGEVGNISMRLRHNVENPIVQQMLNEPVNPGQTYMTDVGPVKVTRTLGDRVEYVMPNGTPGSTTLDRFNLRITSEPSPTVPAPKAAPQTPTEPLAPVEAAQRGVEGQVRQSWDMSVEEYAIAKGARPEWVKAGYGETAKRHRIAVETAASEGKFGVGIRSYPGLMAKYGVTPEVAPAVEGVGAKVQAEGIKQLGEMTRKEAFETGAGVAGEWERAVAERRSAGLSIPPEVAAEYDQIMAYRAKTITEANKPPIEPGPAEDLARGLESKTPNMTTGKSAIREMKRRELDTGDAQDALDALGEVTREDFPDRGDFSDARGEAWSDFTRAVEDAEPLTPKAAPAVGPGAGGILGEAGRFKPRDLLDALRAGLRLGAGSRRPLGRPTPEGGTFTLVDEILGRYPEGTQKQILSQLKEKGLTLRDLKTKYGYGRNLRTPYGIYDAFSNVIDPGSYDTVGWIVDNAGNVVNRGTDVGFRITQYIQDVHDTLLGYDKQFSADVLDNLMKIAGTKKPVGAKFDRLVKNFIKVVEMEKDNPARIAIADRQTPWGEALRGHDRLMEDARQFIVESMNDVGIKLDPNAGITEQGYYNHLFLGELEVREGGKIIGNAETYAGGLKIAADRLKANPAAQITMQGRKQIGFDPSVRVSGGRYFKVVGKISDMVDISNAEVMEALKGTIGRQAMRQKFLGAWEHRTGAEGYSMDYVKVMEGYLNRIVRAREWSKLNHDVQPMLEEIKAFGKPGFATAIQDTLDAIKGTPSKSEIDFGIAIKNNRWLSPVIANPTLALRRLCARLNNLQVWFKLRGSPRSGMLNRLQNESTLWPYTTIVDRVRVYAELLKPETLKMLVDRGVTTTPGKAGEFGASRIPFGKSRPAKGFKLLSQALAGNPLNPLNWFQNASAANRAEGYVYGRMKALDKGMTEAQADWMGRAWAKKCEFDTSITGVQPILRHPVMRVLGQFKSFQGKNIENAINIFFGQVPGVTKLEKAYYRAGRVGKWTGGQLLHGGVKGLTGPWAKAIGIYHLWKAISSNLQERHHMDKEDAEKWADVVIYGGWAAIGQDMSGSITIVDVPFGSTGQEQAANYIFGPTGGTLFGIEEGIRRKRLDVALRGISGGAYKLTDIAKNQNIVRVGNQQIRLTPAETVLRGFGFTPVEQSKYYDLQTAKRLEAMKKKPWSWGPQGESTDTGLGGALGGGGLGGGNL